MFKILESSHGPLEITSAEPGLGVMGLLSLCLSLSSVGNVTAAVDGHL